MTTPTSALGITDLIPKLHAAVPDCPERKAALDVLWRHYEPELLPAARHALRQEEARRGDYLEAAMSGFMHFATRAQHCTSFFAKLTGRDVLAQKIVTAVRDKGREYRMRELKARKSVPYTDPEGPPQPEGNNNLDDRLLYKETMKALRRSLPPLVFRAGLMHLHYRTNAEIAKKLSRSPRTVERYLHRFHQAVDRLRDQ